MKAWLQRRRIEVEDWLRYAPRARDLVSRALLARAALVRPRTQGDTLRLLLRLAAAARLATSPDVVGRALERAHRCLEQVDVRAVDWAALGLGAAATKYSTSVILKAPVSEAEKGVLYLSFEREWVRLLECCDPAELAREYDVVLAPSSSPHNLINYVFPRAFPGTVFTQISNRSDLEELPRISDRFVVVPLYASSWVLPELFQPLPRGRRDVDLLMVANFAKFKRHFALFRALRDMPRDLRVLLIGQSQDGRTAQTVRELARAYGVEGRFTLQTDLPHEEVVSAFCRARASVILSRREGSCVVVAESLFADTPAALLEGAQVGSSAFLNEHTGRALRSGSLAGDLTRFLAEADRYRPRAWALENISCHRSIAVLNAAVRAHVLAAGRPWTVDLAPMHWCPDPCLVRPEDRRRLAAAHDDLRRRHGLRLDQPDPPSPAPRLVPTLDPRP